VEILLSKQMEAADKHAIEVLKIPSVVLMENAAIAVTEEIAKDLDNSFKICIVCGSGNNGGDGFAVARQLVNRGYFVDVVALNVDNLKGDAKTNYEILLKLPVRIYQDNFLNLDFSNYDAIIDAIFGTGLNRRVEGEIETLIQKINISGRHIYAIDIPSGLSGSSSEILGTNINTFKTITFCRPKLPHVMYPAKLFCGEVIVKNISIPDSSVAFTKPDNFLLNKETVPRILPRKPDSHKGSYGHTVIIAGSIGKIGAGILSAKACINSGSGLTTVVTPKNFINAFHGHLPEAMCFNTDSEDFLTLKDLDAVIEFVADKSCLAIGPGLGTKAETSEFVENIIKKTKNKLVIDADGINLIKPEWFEYLAFRTVLTPHIGEFCRLIGFTKEDLIKDRLNICKDFAIRHSVCLVLKSADTIITTPDGKSYIFNEGSAALAKGGSGDVLTGLIASFISQGYSVEDACKIGVYIHGKTGKYIETKYNCMFPKASDLCDNLWVAMNELL
jgi:NAD(P)H-hydrate epimerase